MEIPRSFDREEEPPSAALLHTGIGENRQEIIAIEVDLVDAKIPLLLSRLSLKKMGTSLNFEKNIMEMAGGKSVKLNDLQSGHVSFEFNPNVGKDHVEPGGTMGTFHTEKPEIDLTQDSSTKEVTEAMFWKIHRHLSHCSAQTVKRLCQTAGYRFNVEKGKEWLEQCSCQRDDQIPQTPVVSRHIEEVPGNTLFMDLFYPCSQDAQAHPALIMVCPATRYVTSKFARNLTPGCIIGILLSAWISVMGFPKLIVIDQGRPFQGPLRNQFMDTYSVKMSTIPVESPNQLGCCERQVHLLKLGYRAIERGDEGRWTRENLLDLTCAAHNSAPLSRGMFTPLFLLTGKMNFMSAIEDEEKVITLEHEGIENEHMIRIKAVWQARREMAKLDAKHVLGMAVSASLRTGATHTFEIGSGVKVWTPSEKRWIDGQRVVADAGRNLIIEGGAKLRKIPRQWAQPTMRRERRDLNTEEMKNNHLPREEGKSNRNIEQPSGSSDVSRWEGPKKKYGLRSGVIEESEKVHVCAIASHKASSVYLQQIFEIEPTNEDVQEQWPLEFEEKTIENDPKEKISPEELMERGFDLSRLPPRVYVQMRNHEMQFVRRCMD